LKTLWIRDKPRGVDKADRRTVKSSRRDTDIADCSDPPFEELELYPYSMKGKRLQHAYKWSKNQSQCTYKRDDDMSLHTADAMHGEEKADVKDKLIDLLAVSFRHQSNLPSSMNLRQ